MPRLKAAARKEQIKAVATELFAQSGYDATTTAAIATAAGVTEPILYRHFKNKQQLFVAIVREVSRATIAHFKQTLSEEPDAESRLRRLAAEVPDHIARNATAYRVLHGAMTHSRDKTVLKVIREHYKLMHEFVGRVIRDGQAAGAFRKSMSADAAAWHVVMTGVGYAKLSLNLACISRPTIDEAIEEIARGIRN